MSLPKANRTLLYLVHRVPFPPDKGDRIRTYQILRYLARKANVHLVCLDDEGIDDAALTTLQQYCQRVAVASVQSSLRWARAAFSLVRGRSASEGAFSSSSFRSVIRQWCADTRYDIVLASASSLVPYLRLPELAGVPAVVDLIDVDSQKWFDYAAAGRGPKAWLYGLEGRRVRRLEQNLPLWTRAVTLVSPAEANIYRQFCADGVVEAIGNGVDLDYFQPQPSVTEQGCAFLGALDYRPNVDAVTWFCREVWPAVHRRLPHATFSLVGRRPTPAVCGLADTPGVKLVGQVPDVRPFLANAAASVVPLRIARGIQNKVLESMAMGKATIVSPQALEGIQAEPGEHLLAAASPQEWIELTVKVLEDADLRRRLGVAGRQFTETHHSWERCLQPFDTLLGLSSGPERSANQAISQVCSA